MLFWTTDYSKLFYNTVYNILVPSMNQIFWAFLMDIQMNVSTVLDANAGHFDSSTDEGFR